MPPADDAHTLGVGGGDEIDDAARSAAGVEQAGDQDVRVDDDPHAGRRRRTRAILASIRRGGCESRAR